MAEVIIYKQNNGVIAVIYPSPEFLSENSIQDLAEKDVPTGFPYKIIDITDLPSDRSQRMAWSVDDSDLDDGVGA